MSRLPRLSTVFRRRMFLPFAGVAVLALGLLAGAPVHEPPARPPLALLGPASEEATPESLVPITQGDPAAQRLQLLARLGVARWHAAGYRGQGVKIAILDSGFRGYRSQLGRVLPAHVTARSFRLDGDLEAKDSQHGILCAEVAHTLAPDAELLFANWEPDSPEQFLSAVRWARSMGARALSCSLIMPDWSDGEGGGTVHEELAQLLGPGNDPHDLLLFASAGNTAERHWTGRFHDEGDGFHAWRPGHKDNVLVPWGRERVSVELCWSPGADYDLIVVEAATGREVGRSSADRVTSRGGAVVRFLPEPFREYAVRVRRARGQAETFHLVVLGGSLRYATAHGSIPFPADGPAVVAVGAVDAEGRRMAYSSCGPNSACPKPDFVAAVPFPSLWRPRAFSGTSAAAPQGTALAALWWSRHPDWTARQVRTALRETARDLNTPGHDYETGYGLIHLP